MANQLAWLDFKRVINQFDRLNETAGDFIRWAEELKSLKDEIFDVPERVAELKKIIDIHPDYTIAEISAEYQRLVSLGAYLNDN